MSLKLLLSEIKKRSCVVVGDALKDIYHFGRCDRLSPEAPVPVWVRDTNDTRNGARLGGAMHVYNQLKELGMKVAVLTPPAGIKHRYMVGHHQLFRVDEDYFAEPDWADGIDWVAETRNVDTVILSDYAKGALTHALSETILAAAYGNGVHCVVDPKHSDWTRFRLATLMVPNHKELAAATNTVGFDVVEKCSSDGLKYHSNGVTQHFPACARTVFDVTGAGDIVTAVLGAALAAGAPVADGCRLANIAAGIAVGKVGTSVAPLAEILEVIEIMRV